MWSLKSLEDLMDGSILFIFITLMLWWWGFCVWIYMNNNSNNNNEMRVPDSSCCLGIGAGSENVSRFRCWFMHPMCFFFKTRYTFKIIKNSKWMLEFMKFGTQSNWRVPSAMAKSDFSFEFSNLPKMALKVSGQNL